MRHQHFQLLGEAASAPRGSLHNDLLSDRYRVVDRRDDRAGFRAAAQAMEVHWQARFLP
jgi:hypothetical protein